MCLYFTWTGPKNIPLNKHKGHFVSKHEAVFAHSLNINSPSHFNVFLDWQTHSQTVVIEEAGDTQASFNGVRLGLSSRKQHA